MSQIEPDFADVAEALAAEYALGCLEWDEMRSLEADAATQPQLQALIGQWMARLRPLALLATPVPPPPSLWPRISQSVWPASPGRQIAARAVQPRVLPVPPPLRLTDRAGFWRATTGLALAACVVLGLLLLRGTTPLPGRAGTGPVAVLASTSSPSPGFIARLDDQGMVVVSAISPIPVAPDRDLELWALPPGAPRPISLGVLPVGGARLPLGSTLDHDSRLLVSQEPSGGSPTGQPTGPVLYAGTLAPLR